MKKLFYFLLSLVAFVGCAESETDNTNNNQGGGNTEPPQTEFTVNVTDLLFDADSDVKAIDIYSTDTWSAEFVNDRVKDWCSISPTNGNAGNSSILVSVKDNTTGEERSASIVVKSGHLQKKVKVTQKQNDALTVTSSKLEVKAEGGEVEIEVKANVDYDYSIDDSVKSWVKYKTTRAMETSTLVFDVAENEGVDKREAKITIHSGTISEVVTIYQEGAKPSIILTQNEYIVSDEGETIAVEVKSGVNVGVEILDNVQWVSRVSSRAMSAMTYYFKVEPNDTHEDRVARIKFYNRENNLEEIVTIQQTASPVSSTPTENEIWVKLTSTSYESALHGQIAKRFGTNVTSIKQDGEWYVITLKNGYTTIPDEAFGGWLSEVVIGDGVTTIGKGAFCDCDGLTSVTIPDRVTTIGARAFYDCDGLTSITIPDSVTEIGDYAFDHCSSLTSVTIGNSVTSIGVDVFSSCDGLTAFYGKFASADNRCLIVDGVLNSFAPAGLTEYTIPDSVTSIGEGAFYKCLSLASITIPDSVTTIEWDAFSGCSSLTSVTIPDSVTEIGYAAFRNCSSLTSITIPDSVTEIGDYAFDDCNSLKEVYCKPTTPPTGGYRMFRHNASGRKIYVPVGSVDAYKTAENWEEYRGLIYGYYF